MARPCSVCINPRQADIEEAIIGQATYRQITATFGVSSGAVQRHKKHMGEALNQAWEARDISRADSLLLQVQDLQGRTLAILGSAEKSKDFKTALAAIAQARGCLELLARLTKELQAEGSINVYVAPQWLEIRTVIIETLKPYPAIQADLSRRLAGIEGGEK